MKYIKVYLTNDSRLVRGNELGNEEYFYCHDNSTILRISKENIKGEIKIFKEIFDISSIPGDGFRVMFMDQKQEEKNLDDIIYPVEEKKEEDKPKRPTGRPKIYS